ncbi:MAG: hypothetical protein HYZ91_02275 [Candidatus Omnitrophica bacterium]|nr:hypothetical protein [Candidatus Omnitrophota bacterium]
MAPGCRNHEAHTVNRSEIEERWSGLASWYGGGEGLNNHVAMGHLLDPETFEAAMWDIPFGTMVKVTNLENKRFVIVRITDRGPARRLRPRVIDLTREAFMTLAPLERGLIPVTIEQVL